MLKSNDRWSKKKRGEGEEKKKRKKKENSLSAARFTFVTCFHICHVYVLAPLLERKIALYPSNEGKMIEHHDRELLRGFILERRRNNGEIVKERERSKEEEGRRKARRAKINKLKKKKEERKREIVLAVRKYQSLISLCCYVTMIFSNSSPFLLNIHNTYTYSSSRIFSIFSLFFFFFYSSNNRKSR